MLGALLAHFASNNLGYLFILWTPTFYKDVLRTSQVMAGAYISFPMTVSIWLPFLVGALENRMRSGGMPLLQIRVRPSRRHQSDRELLQREDGTDGRACALCRRR